MQFNDFYTDHNEFNYPDLKHLIKSVSFGCPSELVPDRSEILKQLGISQEEDEIFQEQYKNV